jgi:hypothetical protein
MRRTMVVHTRLAGLMAGSTQPVLGRMAFKSSAISTQYGGYDTQHRGFQ